jgi:hypothetical protein
MLLKKMKLLLSKHRDNIFLSLLSRKRGHLSLGKKRRVADCRKIGSSETPDGCGSCES